MVLLHLYTGYFSISHFVVQLLNSVEIIRIKLTFSIKKSVVQQNIAQVSMRKVTVYEYFAFPGDQFEGFG